MDGPTLAGRLRAIGLTTAIVGVTGNALDEDRSVFVRAGADAVVTKPCTSAKLIGTLAGMGWSLPGSPGR
jgi:CheY-like chemotaxis protein